MALFSLGGDTSAAGLPRFPRQFEQAFQTPPPSARPWVYWFWMDGNVSREGITADLEAMRHAGLGGVILMEVDVGIPRGPVRFMNPEWRALFRHAVIEAERLGLEITLNAGPGWTGSGGPWVRPEQSMQHIVASETNAVAGRPFAGALPPPPAKAGFYEDIAVLAFPTPAIESRIADIQEKALYKRDPYSSQPNVKPFLPAPADHAPVSPESVIRSDRIVDLTDRLTPEGRLTWDAPELTTSSAQGSAPATWTLLRFGRTSTGANTRPAPEPGIGLECDKFDPAALDAHFEAFVGSLLREIGPRPATRTAGWTMLHIDSWEMGAQNWTGRFREEFRQRRGYDLLPYLPAVTGRIVESPGISERFLWDLRETAQELVIRHHARHLRDLGRRHGFGLSIEPYDMNPCADLRLGAIADVPMGEFWAVGYGFDTVYSCIEAVSIAHTQGRPVVAAEAFTADAPEAWQLHPAAMKAQGDWAFACGLNRLVFHRYAHQPWPDRWPGMTMGPYGVHYERTQTWWDLANPWHLYLARCQHLLRQGVPVADICYLTAEGAPHVFRAPPTALRGPPLLPDRREYNFDACDPHTLMTQMRVRHGELRLPGGARYRVLVLPESPTATPQLLRKVKQLAAAGATVLGSPPQKSPSLSGYPQCDREVTDLANALWGDPSKVIPGVERRVGRGRVIASHGVTPPPAPPPPPRLPPEAHWIWYPEGQPAAAAPVGTRHFRRAFHIESPHAIASARLLITADNAFTAVVNDKPLGTGDDFHRVYRFDCAEFLVHGTNWISVLAENGADSPNPAGLVADLELRDHDGHERTLPTDATWEAAVAASGPWRPAQVLGPLGMGPWGRVGEDTEPTPFPNPYGDYAEVADVLSAMGVLPDFESGASFRYTHRRGADWDLYFISNPESTWRSALCSFRVTGRTPELWDPRTGDVRAQPAFTLENRRTLLRLSLEPHGSVFVLFRKAPAPEGVLAQRITAIRRDGHTLWPHPAVSSDEPPPFEWTSRPDRPLRVRLEQPGRYQFTTADGTRHTVDVPVLPSPVVLTGPWEVRFQPGRGAPEIERFPELIDWSRHANPDIRHFSGWATYRRTFHVPQERTGPSLGLCLDLGAVHELARVRINGRDVGIAWKPPFRLDITSVVTPGENTLEITVANLWPNRLIGDRSLPAAQRVASTTWNPYKPDSALLPSGLLGPVTLQSIVESSIEETQ